jgi:gentisate 1,2-dioxygenase
MRCRPLTRKTLDLASESECVLLSYSDRAAQEALGFRREEGPSNAAARQARELI